MWPFRLLIVIRSTEYFSCFVNLFLFLLPNWLTLLSNEIELEILSIYLWMNYKPTIWITKNFLIFLVSITYSTHLVKEFWWMFAPSCIHWCCDKMKLVSKFLKCCTWMNFMLTCGFEVFYYYKLCQEFFINKICIIKLLSRMVSIEMSMTLCHWIEFSFITHLIIGPLWTI